MMHFRRGGYLVIALLAVSASKARATPTYTLSAFDPTTMTQLDSGGLVIVNSGQTIQINVNLTGLDTPDTLDYLNVGLSVPDMVFNSATTPVAGKIVTDADSNGFTAVMSPSSANPVGAIYDASPTSSQTSTPISENGVFFSFTLTAPSVTSQTFDTISFQTAEYEVTGTFPFPATPSNLPTLQITINGSATVATPEPATLGLGLVGLAVLTIPRLWTRRGSSIG